MKLRKFVNASLVLICLGAIWAVVTQHQHLVALRAQQRDFLAQLAGLSEKPAAADSTVQPVRPDADSPSSIELMRLRNEITRLMDQRRALANVRAENDRLRAQAASRATNAGLNQSTSQLFVRKDQAQMVGFSSPENTIQSVLWALQNRNFNTFLEALTPDAAEKVRADLQQPGSSVEDFFHETERIAGLAILNQHSTDDGQIQAEVQMIPTNYLEGATLEPPDTVHFVQVNGQWKVQGPF